MTLARRLQTAARLGPIHPGSPGEPGSAYQPGVLRDAAHGHLPGRGFLSDTALCLLRNAVLSTLRSKCDMGANTGLLFAEIGIRGREVGPELKVAHNRILALARAWERGPRLKARRIWALHPDARHPATNKNYCLDLPAGLACPVWLAQGHGGQGAGGVSPYVGPRLRPGS